MIFAVSQNHVIFALDPSISDTAMKKDFPYRVTQSYILEVVTDIRNIKCKSSITYSIIHKCCLLKKSLQQVTTQRLELIA
jgi:hypothetical protein